ncbi:MAG: hypothetical protein IPH24_07955 [Crocinitomicaceae bacterium]|nr:hypothetical protein [Crocinitomicaceae bacterium]
MLDWDDNLAISGVGFPDGCAIGTGGACFYSVKRTTVNAYVDVTNILQPLTNGKGFDVYMGDDTIVFSGVTLDVTGTVHGSSDYIVNFNHGWNLQGNALVSPVTWSSLTKSHVGNYYYIYDTGSGNMGGVMGYLIHQVQRTCRRHNRAGQGYWTYDFGSITYKQADKTANTATFVRNEAVDLSAHFRLIENNFNLFMYNWSCRKYCINRWN